jgi:hypothetical protein
VKIATDSPEAGQVETATGPDLVQIQVTAWVSCGKEGKHGPCSTDSARVLHGVCTGVHALFSTRPFWPPRNATQEPTPTPPISGRDLRGPLQSENRAGPGSQAESVFGLGFCCGKSQGLKYDTSGVLTVH